MVMSSPTTNNEALAETKEMDWPHMDRSVPINQNLLSTQLEDTVIRLFLITPELKSDAAAILEEMKKNLNSVIGFRKLSFS